MGADALAGNESRSPPAAGHRTYYEWNKRGSLIRGFVHGMIISVLTSFMLAGLAVLADSLVLGLLSYIGSTALLLGNIMLSALLILHITIYSTRHGLPGVAVEVALCGRTLISRHYEDLVSVWCRKEYGEPMGDADGGVFFRLSAMQRGVTVDLVGWDFEYFFGLRGAELAGIADAWRAAAQEAGGDSETAQERNA